jgi:Pyruvate/2-oxoacid:ferredoxin oxidoreductase delta subunit
MRRKIVKIDESKCNGCGRCATACAEGAIAIIDGKARIVSETYCDGLGACLGKCPVDAITIEERDAPAFDEAAAMKHVAETRDASAHGHSHGHGRSHDHDHGHAHPHPHTHSHGGFACPGTLARSMKRPAPAPCAAGSEAAASDLSHWPVQLALLNPAAECFNECDLLLAADCVPFAMPDFHARFLRGRTVAVGCPKLDDASYYAEKLAEILRANTIKSLTVVHMEVPCCFGLSRLAEIAVKSSGKDIPVRDVTVGLDGKVKSER